MKVQRQYDKLCKTTLNEVRSMLNENPNYEYEDVVEIHYLITSLL